MKLAIFTCGVVLATAGPLVGQEQRPTMTLEDAVELGRRRNPLYRRAVIDANAASAGVWSGYGAFLPTMNANVNWNGSRRTTVTGTDDFGQSIELPSPITFRSSSASQSVQGGLTLFDGFQNLNNLRAARRDLDAAEYGVDAAGIAVDAEVKRRFYDALRSQRLIDVELRLLESASERLDANQRLFRVASATQADVLGAQVDLALQQQQVESARGEARKARLRVLQQLGVLDETLDFQPVGSFPDEFDPAPLVADELVSRALRISPDLASSTATVSAARRRASAARGQRLPTVSLNGSFGRSLQEQEYGAFWEFNPRDRGLNFSMSLSLPIFTGFQTAQAIARADQSVRNADQNSREAKLRTEQGVRSALIDLENAHQGLQVRRRAASLSRRRVELERERFRLGSITFTNLQQIIEQAANQERALVNAEHAFAAALATLEEQVGEPIAAVR